MAKTSKKVAPKAAAAEPAPRERRKEWHRGPGKYAKRSIVIYLEPEVHDELIDLANQNLRSAVGQATWFILQGLQATPRKTRSTARKGGE